MDKKLEFKTGIMHQLYIAVFISIGIVFLYIFFFIFALIIGEPALKSLIGLYPFVYPLIAIWLIFFLVRIIFRTKLTVTEKGFVMKMWRKVLWEMDWSEIEKIEYFTMSWNFFLSLNFYSGNLVFTRIKAEPVSTKIGSKLKRIKRERTAVLFQKDVKKIISTFDKDIKIKAI